MKVYKAWRLDEWLNEGFLSALTCSFTRNQSRVASPCRLLVYYVAAVIYRSNLHKLEKNSTCITQLEIYYFIGSGFTMT